MSWQPTWRTMAVEHTLAVYYRYPSWSSCRDDPQDRVVCSEQLSWPSRRSEEQSALDSSRASFIPTHPTHMGVFLITFKLALSFVTMVPSKIRDRLLKLILNFELINHFENTYCTCTSFIKQTHFKKFQLAKIFIPFF